MGTNGPIQRQAADVIASDVARYGYDDQRENKGKRVLPWPGCLPLIVLAVMVTITGLLVGFIVFGTPQPGPTSAPTSSPEPTPTPSASPSPSPSPSPTPSPSAIASESPPASASASPAAPGGAITSYCIRVEHTQLGEFLSYLEWLLLWTGDTPIFFELVVLGANDGQPASLFFDPSRSGWYGQLGLHETGTKTIVSLVAHWPDGSTTDLTDDMIDAFGGDEIDTDFPAEAEYGDCAQAGS